MKDWSQLEAPPPFVGDLSTQDAAVLATIAKDRRVLEFGTGGSTQIFAQVAGYVMCVETDGAWISTTQRNFARLGIRSDHVRFSHYALDQVMGTGPYDVIFVDGAPPKRAEFALATWAELREGGLMVFHDCRVERPMVGAVCAEKLWEIEAVDFDVANSNMAVVRKRVPPVYVNWNVAEGRKPWEFGANEEIPSDLNNRVSERTARYIDRQHLVPIPSNKP